MNLENLTGKHKRKDIYILGCGTSLDNFDYSVLDGEITIATNRAIMAYPATYWTFFDKALTQDVKGKIPKTTTIVTSDDRIKLLDHEYRKQWCECEHYKIKKLDAFSVDIKVSTKQLFHFRTIITAGLFLAWHLGARRIFVLGMDGYYYPDKYYGMCKAPEARYKVENDHVYPDGRVYSDAQRFWNRALSHIADWFDHRGLYQGPFPEGGIYNLSPKSTIRAFEKVDVKDVF